MLYNFTLKDNNQRTYNLFTWFLFFGHIVAAAWFALKSTDGQLRAAMYSLLGFYVIITFVYFFFRKHKKAMETFSLILALLYANFWFTTVGIMAVILFGAVYVFAAVVKGKKTSLLIMERGVQLTRLFKTVLYRWPEMDNVILKDNLLTLDFKSNKIIQAEIADSAEPVDEKSFNDFCTLQLQDRS